MFFREEVATFLRVGNSLINILLLVVYVYP